jgi:DUF4097 and DUF4098 domain-containing protein YvlB
VNGNASVELIGLGPDLVDARTTNGDVELVLPAETNANLQASVTNGRIDVQDVNFEPMGEQRQRRIRGRLNAGGTPIELVTVNGKIVVRPRYSGFPSPAAR